MAAVFFLLALLAFTKHMRIRDKRPSMKTTANDYEYDRNGNFANKEPVKNYRNAGLCLVLEPYLMLTVIFAACAMFSKEQGVTVLGMFQIRIQ